MERLTKRMDHGILMVDGYDFGIDPDDYDVVQEILGRLAAYEDTGLDPEMFRAAFTEEALLKLTAQCLKTTPDRLLELGKADGEGRLVVLPWAIGTHIFNANKRLEEVGEYVVSHYSVYFERIFITAVLPMYPSACRVFSVENIGKTVFLTREEAEVALRKENE